MTVVLGLRDGVSGVSVLLACDTASLDNYRQTSRKSVLVSSSKVGLPKRKNFELFFATEYEANTVSREVDDH